MINQKNVSIVSTTYFQITPGSSSFLASHNLDTLYADVRYLTRNPYNYN